MEKQAFRRVPVESSMIKSVGHSFPRRMLEIEFKDGSVYRYKGVKKKAFEALLSSESKGKHFHQNIKAQYPYKKYQAKDGSKTGGDYYMKTACVRDYDEFCKVAEWAYRDGKVTHPKYSGAYIFTPYQAPASKPQRQGNGWEPEKPLSKKEKVAYGALLAAGTTLGLMNAAHKISEKRKMKKKKKELQEAGWIKEK